MGVSHIYHRKVTGLVPDGPLDPIFATGEKKLVPIVYCHGNMACGEEAYGACMILAAHGYLVISLDFMDGTATVSNDKDGNKIPFTNRAEGMVNPDGSPSDDFNEGLRTKFDQRKIEVHALGDQIMSDGFAKEVLNFNCSLDTDKMTVAGYSMGAWTAL